MARQLPRLVCQPPGWSPRVWASTDLFRASVLCSAASSCRNRGANRGFSRLGWSAEPTLLSLSWHKPRGGGVLVSLSLAQTGGSSTSKTARNLADVARRTVRLPRVVIRGRPAPCAELARCVRRRPRVAIVVQTGGETLGGKWLCVFLSIL